MEAIALFAHKKAERPFEVYEIFLLQRDGGLLIFHKQLKRISKIDQDLLAGMFEAIQIFIKTSFDYEGSDDLQILQYGPLHILVENGEGFSLVIVGEGEQHSMIRYKMKTIVHRLNIGFSASIKKWKGVGKATADIDKTVMELLE